MVPTAIPLNAGKTPAAALLARSAMQHHIVQFYDDDVIVCEHVAYYLAAGLAAGEPVIAIATEAHCAYLGNWLTALGYDIAMATASGQLTMLEAHATLETFMHHDQPARDVFHARFDRLIDQACVAAAGKRVRAYGEMVDVLWREGHRDAALSLERLWCDLARRRPLSLLCTYAMAGFYKESDSEAFEAICDVHSDVVCSTTSGAHRRSPD